MVATPNARQSTCYFRAPYLRRFFIAIIVVTITAITLPNTLALVIVSVIVKASP